MGEHRAAGSLHRLGGGGGVHMYEAVVCAQIRDEDPQNLDEWLAFHNAQDIHVVLYDHHSKVPVTLSASPNRSMDVVSPYPSRSVLADRCRDSKTWTRGAQRRMCSSLRLCLNLMEKSSLNVSENPCRVAALDDCYARYSQRTRWIGSWDPDEYLFPCRRAPANASQPRDPSILTLAAKTSVSSIEFMPVRFGLRSIDQSSRLHGNFWRAPYAHLHEHVRCPLEQLNNLTDDQTRRAGLGSFCEAEGAQKLMSQPSAFNDDDPHPLKVHHHGLRPTVRKLRWRQSVGRGFCANHYAYSSVQQIERKTHYVSGELESKTHYIHGTSFRQRIAASGVFNSSWFSVYDDTVLRWLSLRAPLT